MDAGYAFQSPAWDGIFSNSALTLTHVWQQQDVESIDMLNELRVRVISEALGTLLEQRKQVYDEAMHSKCRLSRDITHSFPRTLEVRAHNNKCLAQIAASDGCHRHIYKAVDRANGVKLHGRALCKFLDNILLAPRRLEHCLGVRVAFCASTLAQRGIFNGTIGDVVGFKRNTKRAPPFSTFTSVPVVRFSTVNGAVSTTEIAPEARQLLSVQRVGPFAECTQVPLVLPWAVTVHHVQGISMERAVLYRSCRFAPGMLYVSLSSVLSMSGVFIKSFERSKVVADATVRQFYDTRDSLAQAFSNCLASAPS